MHGDASRARVTDGIRQRFLRDAEDLALDTAPEGRQIVDDEIDRHVGRAAREIRHALERGADIFDA